MARGWGSKSVEDQIGAAEEERAARRKDLQATADTRYRTLLERTLAHLDAQLEETTPG